VAYASCISHGIDVGQSMERQKAAVGSGYWPLYRVQPQTAADGHPLHLDSRAPTTPYRDFAMREARFATLARSQPEVSEELMALAQGDIDERRRLCEQLAGVERSIADPPDSPDPPDAPDA